MSAGERAEACWLSGIEALGPWISEHPDETVVVLVSPMPRINTVRGDVQDQIDAVGLCVDARTSHPYRWNLSNGVRVLFISGDRSSAEMVRGLRLGTFLVHGYEYHPDVFDSLVVACQRSGGLR